MNMILIAVVSLVAIGLVSAILGLKAEASEPKVAVVRCNGTCDNRPRLTQYDGVRCRLHRMWQMRKNLSVRSYHTRKQPCE